MNFFIDDYFLSDVPDHLGAMGAVLLREMLIRYFSLSVSLITDTDIHANAMRRWVIVVILVLAAIITPPDVLDQMLFSYLAGVPLYRDQHPYFGKSYRDREKKEKAEWS